MKNNKGFISLLLLDSNRNLGSVRNTISETSSTGTLGAKSSVQPRKRDAAFGLFFVVAARQQISR
jgi:hypothetical protein